LPVWSYRAAIAVARVLPRYRSLTPAVAERMNQDMVVRFQCSHAGLGYQAAWVHVGDASMSVIAMVVVLLVSALSSGLLSRYHGRFALLDKPTNVPCIAKPHLVLAGSPSSRASWPPAAAPGRRGGSPALAAALLALFMVAGVSFADDVRPLPAWLRFLVHFLAAILLVCAAGFDPSLRLLPGVEWLAPLWALRIFCVVFNRVAVNLYNFMDGMDGLAGGMAVSGFGTFCAPGLSGRLRPLTPSLQRWSLWRRWVSCVQLPAGAPVHGRRGLGFPGVPGGALHAARRASAALPAVAGALVFSPFIVDATWTVIRRALHGRRPWQAPGALLPAPGAERLEPPAHDTLGLYPYVKM